MQTGTGNRRRCYLRFLSRPPLFLQEKTTKTRKKGADRVSTSFFGRSVGTRWISSFLFFLLLLLLLFDVFVFLLRPLQRTDSLPWLQPPYFFLNLPLFFCIHPPFSENRTVPSSGRWRNPFVSTKLTHFLWFFSGWNGRRGQGRVQKSGRRRRFLRHHLQGARGIHEQ